MLNDEIGYVPKNYDTIANEAIRAWDAVLLGLSGRRWGFARVSIWLAVWAGSRAPRLSRRSGAGVLLQRSGAGSAQPG